MLKNHYISLLALCVMLISCENTTFRSSVPTAPVQLTINTEAGAYVHFVTANIGEYMIIDNAGYHYHEQTLPLTSTDYYGYSGVLLYVTNDQKYAAFDLCCPHCVKRHQPCALDGIYLVCPNCDEHYDISYGYGTPSKSISKEALRKYTTIYSNHRLTVRD